MSDGPTNPAAPDGNELPPDATVPPVRPMPPMPPAAEIATPSEAAEPLRPRVAALGPRVAPYVITVDGVLMVVVGGYALVGAVNSFQGEGFLLLVAGLGLILFGAMTILRWNLSLVRTGLVGLTAGYFASALQEFQVATDPCDIGATFERCVGHVAGGSPWVVYQGPLLLSVLLFVFIAFEPALAARAS